MVSNQSGFSKDPWHVKKGERHSESSWPNHSSCWSLSLSEPSNHQVKPKNWRWNILLNIFLLSLNTGCSDQDKLRELELAWLELLSREDSDIVLK
jgi:hypothetical protein